MVATIFNDLAEALTLIERMKADNTRMRQALELIATSHITDAVPEVREIARLGLGGDTAGRKPSSAKRAE